MAPVHLRDKASSREGWEKTRHLIRLLPMAAAVVAQTMQSMVQREALRLVVLPAVERLAVIKPIQR